MASATSKRLGSTVLLVEDVDNMRVATAGMLMDMGCKRVLQARNGCDALQILKDSRVDIIVSDWIMPKMDGLTLLQKIREQPSMQSLPFVMSTSVIEQNSVRAAIKAGVSEYIAKPFSFKMLQNRIDSAFDNPLSQRIKAGGAKGPATIRSNSEKHSEQGCRPYTVLVVDDITTNIQIIADVIKSQAKIKAATSGKKAIQICQMDNPPDLVILDVMMPDLDGYGVIERLKQNTTTRDIPVMFVTAKSQVEDLVKGFELGAVDYLTKPISPPELCARVTSQKRLWQYRHSLKQQLDMVLENLQLREDLDRIVQHDINNPLAAISALAEDISRNSKDPKRSSECAQRIVTTVDMLSSMVGNLFTISKIEDGNFKADVKMVQLSPVVKQVAEALELQAKEKCLQVSNEIDDQLHVLADPVLTYSLLCNLLSNAIEAAPRGSKILWAEQAENRIFLYNIGAVNPCIRERFFDKYVTSGKCDGTGIGTYAAKLFAKAQRGDVDVCFGENDTKVLVRFAAPA